MKGESAGGESACPRVERAARMWSGFMVDVPNEALGQALEVVTPIQAALGQMFCARQVSDCRPAALLAIELTSASANEAQLRVRLDSGAGPQELPLVVLATATTWSAEPESLAQYLASCRGVMPETTKAAP